MAPFYVHNANAISRATQLAAIMMAQGDSRQAILDRVRDNLPNASNGQIGSVLRLASQGRGGGVDLSSDTLTGPLGTTQHRLDRNIASNYQYTIAVRFTGVNDATQRNRIFVVDSAHRMTYDELVAAAEAEAVPLLESQQGTNPLAGDTVSTFEVRQVMDAARAS